MLQALATSLKPICVDVRPGHGFDQLELGPAIVERQAKRPIGRLTVVLTPFDRTSVEGISPPRSRAEQRIHTTDSPLEVAHNECDLEWHKTCERRNHRGKSLGAHGPVDRTLERPAEQEHRCVYDNGCTS